MQKKLEKIRLDQLLVDKGLVENASKAKARIMAGDVIVNDHRIDKPGQKFLSDVNIRLRGNSHPFVSRGGLKLERALSLWPCNVNDQVCIDVGASTGGFTDVLLRNGAKKVYAVDVGYGQLAEPLRVNSQVVNLERTHILKLDENILDPKPSIAVIDVSFISVTKILPRVSELLQKPCTIFALIKPQFEAGPEKIEKGGIVKDPSVHEECVEKIKTQSLTLGFIILGVAPSPIFGAKGNKEFLIGLRKT